MAVVRTQDVKKVYVMGEISVHALKGVDVEIELAGAEAEASTVSEFLAENDIRGGAAPAAPVSGCRGQCCESPKQLRWICFYSTGPGKTGGYGHSVSAGRGGLANFSIVFTGSGG